MYLTDFEYDGELLSDYRMMICRFNSGDFETLSSGADLTFSQVRPSGSNHFNLYSSVYQSPLSATFHICKNPCYFSRQEELYLSPREVSAIQRWLCRKDGYKRFKIFKEGYEHIYWNGTFSSKQVCLNDRVIGMELTLYTDAPYSYMDEISVEYTCTAGASFDLWDNSDEVTDTNTHLRPDMEITLLSGGNFTLKNSLDNKIMQIKNCNSGEIISIKGKNKIITSSLTHDLSKDFNYYFPRIINTYENRRNIFTPGLDCKIRITYSPVRRTGL